MPTNANTFNSRVTSESLEQKFRQVFPSQAGAELVQDLFASGVIQPVVDFTDTALGSVLRADLQVALDAAVTRAQLRTADAGTTKNILTSTGFFRVDYQATLNVDNTGVKAVVLQLNDGSTATPIHRIGVTQGINDEVVNINDSLIVFMRPGDTLQAIVQPVFDNEIEIFFRQVADLYGNLTNPLGFVSQ